MRFPFAAYLVSLLVFSPACDDSESEDMDTDTGMDTDMGDDAATGSPQVPPGNPTALGPWLEAGHYANWAAESAIHGSTGPHFGNVRTWLNDTAIQALTAGTTPLPLGSATVKELYGDGQTRRGWAVSVKVGVVGDDQDWYWYEGYDGEVVAEGRGKGLCANCHRGGTDFVLTPFPLN